jgi:hypothetical protein
MYKVQERSNSERYISFLTGGGTVSESNTAHSIINAGYTIVFTLTRNSLKGQRHNEPVSKPTEVTTLFTAHNVSVATPSSR